MLPDTQPNIIAEIQNRVSQFPPEGQQEVLDFVMFLQSRKPHTPQAPAQPAGQPVSNLPPAVTQGQEKPNMPMPGAPSWLTQMLDWKG